VTGVTVVMPAYREEENLSATVEDFLRTLEAAGERHRVVVVDDGSPDETGRIADDLAARYPGRVEVVHHEVNRGYGAAVRTGISAALGHADSQRVFLTDSDGQFRADQLPGFLDLARTERADAVIGYRTRRADPLIRRVNGVLWTLLSRALLRVGARDIDCAYKLVDKRVLAETRH
jgi:glycosyltransferase involved in cell wall biosynthesis